MSCENEHFHSHGDDHDEGDHVPPIPTFSGQLLNNKIDLPHLRALNLANPVDQLGQLFKSEDNRFSIKPVIRSDADEQLILHIPFLNGLVKLHSIILRTNGDKFCPHTINIWKNNANLDFDTADAKPHFVLNHPEVGIAAGDDDEGDDLPDSLEGTDFVEHHVPRHVFSGVHHLTMFFRDIHGDEDMVQLHSIELRGEFTELSKNPVVTLYELAPNPKDHKVEDIKSQVLN